MKRPEQSLQRSITQYLDAVKTPDWEWWATPNGGYRRRVEAAIFSGLGVKSGIPDICICHRGLIRFMELKAPKGRLSENQRLMIERLRLSGAETRVITALSQVTDALVDWQIPTREKGWPKATPFLPVNGASHAK